MGSEPSTIAELNLYQKSEEPPKYEEQQVTSPKSPDENVKSIHLQNKSENIDPILLDVLDNIDQLDVIDTINPAMATSLAFNPSFNPSFIVNNDSDSPELYTNNDAKSEEIDEVIASVDYTETEHKSDPQFSQNIDLTT
eukprot:270541_1